MAKPINTKILEERIENTQVSLVNLYRSYEANIPQVISAINENEKNISRLKIFAYSSAFANLILLYLILS